jgi:hypothetical protein
MHNYLNIFYDQDVIDCMSNIRKKGNISIEQGTLSNQQIISALNLSDSMIASIQTYEYILYDFLLNSEFQETLTLKDKEGLYSLLNHIFTGSNTNHEQSLNSSIGGQIDHTKYCNLYARIKTPDYLKVIRDRLTTDNLAYLRIQNGISIKLGTASKPGILENTRWPKTQIAAIQLYEYILYDILLNQEIHNSLTDEEEKHFMIVLNAVFNGELFNPERVGQLEEDIATSNTIISKWIDNKKYFELFGKTDLASSNDKMYITDTQNVIVLGFISQENIQKGLEYYKNMRKAS